MAARCGGFLRRCVLKTRYSHIQRISNSLVISGEWQLRFYSAEAEHQDDKKQADSLAAMIAAAQGRRTAYDALIKKEESAFEKGRRHLANMMGEEPESFTQDDIDRAIEYLLPSGLFDKRARPMMKPPQEYYPPQKAAQFGPDGRPFDTLFYTGKPNYYNLMHDTVSQMNRVVAKETQMVASGVLVHEAEPVNLARSEWLDKASVERIVVETLTDKEYGSFIGLLERIVQLPYAGEVESYLQRFRRELVAELSKQTISPIQLDEAGRPFCLGEARRKTATAKVTLRDHGRGQVTVNGMEFLKYFPWVRVREQVLFPFHFTGTLSRFDLECEVEGGGRTSQAGAVRLASAKALCSFLDEHQVEQLRQAGLLTLDPRTRERKKPGQAGARKKFTWKKR